VICSYHVFMILVLIVPALSTDCVCSPGVIRAAINYCEDAWKGLRAGSFGSTVTSVDNRVLLRDSVKQVSPRSVVQRVITFLVHS
jgi:hypothetical protein